MEFNPATGHRVLLVGLGQLGGRVLDQLAVHPRRPQLFVLSRHMESALPRANLARLVAIHRGFDPVISLRQADLLETEQASALVAECNPDIVFNATSLQSWWVIRELPKEVFARLSQAHVGPWLSMHLTLTKHLMEAVAAASSSAIVVNASYPDVVNPVLSRIGLGPLTGIGNVANPIPALRSALAAAVGVPVSRARVRLTAHHYVSHAVSATGSSGGAPFHLSSYIDNEEVTAVVDEQQLLEAAARDFRRPGGLEGNPITAASAMTVLDTLLGASTEDVIHAPGPLGLPGGYPIRLSQAGALEVAVSHSCTLEDAVDINTRGQVFDGVQEIRDDGTVRFTDEAVQIMTDVLGYSHTCLSPADAVLHAEELSLRYAALKRRVGCH